MVSLYPPFPHFPHRLSNACYFRLYRQWFSIGSISITLASTFSIAHYCSALLCIAYHCSALLKIALHCLTLLCKFSLYRQRRNEQHVQSCSFWVWAQNCAGFFATYVLSRKVPCMFMQIFVRNFHHRLSY